MGKTVYIVLALVNNSVEVDSVWWNKRKAKKRKDEIDKCSDGAGIVIDKWVNPKILLSATEYTNSRVAKERVVDSILIFDVKCLKLLN